LIDYSPAFRHYLIIDFRQRALHTMISPLLMTAFSFFISRHFHASPSFADY